MTILGAEGGRRGRGAAVTVSTRPHTPHWPAPLTLTDLDRGVSVTGSDRSARSLSLSLCVCTYLCCSLSRLPSLSLSVTFSNSLSTSSVLLQPWHLNTH